MVLLLAVVVERSVDWLDVPYCDCSEQEVVVLLVAGMIEPADSLENTDSVGSLLVNRYWFVSAFSYLYHFHPLGCFLLHTDYVPVQGNCN